MSRLCTIGEAARLLGVSIPTLRRWEESGKLVPERTAGKHRRYDITKLKPELAIADTTRTTIAYARVSSHDQREDLERQKQVLELYCAQHGWNFTLLSDLGSGMNYHKKGLRRLLDAILSGDVGRLVITHKVLSSYSPSAKQKMLKSSSSTRGRNALLKKILPKTSWRSSRSFPPGSTAVDPIKTKSFLKTSKKQSRIMPCADGPQDSP